MSVESGRTKIRGGLAFQPNGDRSRLIPPIDAEVYAANQLLNNGSNIKNIIVYTQQIGRKLNATIKPPCPQCGYIFDGVNYVH
jgi:hypothetical protein